MSPGNRTSWVDVWQFRRSAMLTYETVVENNPQGVTFDNPKNVLLGNVCNTKFWLQKFSDFRTFVFVLLSFFVLNFVRHPICGPHVFAVTAVGRFLCFVHSTEYWTQMWRDPSLTFRGVKVGSVRRGLEEGSPITCSMYKETTLVGTWKY